MPQLLFKDISYAQGVYDMSSNKDQAIMMKMSGFYTGSLTGYYDDQAARNYNNAVSAGKVPLMYHFAGGADAIAEADWFVKAVSPLAENDVLALDWEIQHDSPVAWVNAFVTHVHDRTGIWPWVYMNMSTANAYDWSPVFANCGYWCAAPSYSFDDVLPVKYPQIAQQGAIVNGVDTNAFFGTLDQLKAYGYHAQVTPPPAPVVTTEVISNTKVIPHKSSTINDPNLPKGNTVISTIGVDGVETLTYSVTLTDGVETSKVLVSDVVTTPAIDEVVSVGTQEPVVPTPSLWDQIIMLINKVIAALKKDK